MIYFTCKGIVACVNNAELRIFKGILCNAVNLVYCKGWLLVVLKAYNRCSVRNKGYKLGFGVKQIVVGDTLFNNLVNTGVKVRKKCFAVLVCNYRVFSAAVCKANKEATPAMGFPVSASVFTILRLGFSSLRTTS